MADVEIAGTTLHVVDCDGDGPPCLILHGGLGMDHTYFRPAFDRLRERVRLVYFDQRSNGRSGRPALETLTMERLADDAAELAQVLGADRFLAIGHSYGGFVGQELAIRHPERLFGLVLLNTTPGGLGTTEDPAQPQGDPPPAEQLEIMRSPVTSDAEMATMMRRLMPFYLHGMEAADLAPHLADTVFSHQAMIRSSELLATWSSYDRLDDIRCPTFIAAGRHDTFCSTAQSERIASRIADAELVVFEQSGHFPWIEEGAAFWTALESWLDRRVVSG